MQGTSNTNANALSHALIVEENKVTHTMVQFSIIVAMNAGRFTVQEDGLPSRQKIDLKL